MASTKRKAATKSNTSKGRPKSAQAKRPKATASAQKGKGRSASKSKPSAKGEDTGSRASQAMRSSLAALRSRLV